MIEKEVFKELNTFGSDGGPSEDLMEDNIPQAPEPSTFNRMFSCCCCKDQVFTIFCV